MSRYRLIRKADANRAVDVGSCRSCRLITHRHEEQATGLDVSDRASNKGIVADGVVAARIPFLRNGGVIRGSSGVALEDENMLPQHLEACRVRNVAHSKRRRQRGAVVEHIKPSRGCGIALHVVDNGYMTCAPSSCSAVVDHRAKLDALNVDLTTNARGSCASLRHAVEEHNGAGRVNDSSSQTSVKKVEFLSSCGLERITSSTSDAGASQAQDRARDGSRPSAI